MRFASVFPSNWAQSNWGRWALTAGTGYGYMFSVLVTTAIATPAAVHYLGVREYGLWAIAAQLMTYVKLLDLGLSRSMQRLVAEALIGGNDQGRRRYTLLWVFSALMSLFLFLAGVSFCRFGLRFLAVPPDLLGVGTTLFVGLLFIFSLGYFFAPCQGILYAQNRLYLTGFFDTLSLWLNLALFLFFLHRGVGLLSYFYATAIITPICLCLGVYAVFRGPPTPQFSFSLPSGRDIREVFGFSGSIFINGVLSQFQMTFPFLLVSHYAGLATAGKFYLGSRLAIFLYQFLLQPSESLTPRWQNLYLTGRLERLRHEFSETWILLSQIAIVGATCFAAGLKPLLILWMGPVMYPGSSLTMAFSLYVGVAVIAGFIPKPFVWAKAFIEMSIPLLVELIVILPICSWVIRSAGAGPMLMVAVGGTALVTAGYYGVRGPRFLGAKNFATTWTPRDFRDLLIQLAGLALAFVAIRQMNLRGTSIQTEFVVGALLSAGSILFLFLSQGPRLKRIYLERKNRGAAPDPSSNALG